MTENGYEIKEGILDLSGLNIDRIENKRFLGAKAVREVIFPAGIEYIGDWAFAKCSNLEKVTFPQKHVHGLFGKDVFKGCDNLSEIRFLGTDDVTSYLLALCTNRLYCDHLVRADDVGKKSWFEKWDISLVSLLKSDDEKNAIAAALCGEEDISYDGIGSVDGELPGQTPDYVSKMANEKCTLCYIRLEYDRYLSDGTRETIEDHILKNSLGNCGGHSFYSIFEMCDGNLSYLSRYLDIVRPDRDGIRQMISALSPRDVYAMSYLLERSNRLAGDDLML